MLWQYDIVKKYIEAHRTEKQGVKHPISLQLDSGIKIYKKKKPSSEYALTLIAKDDSIHIIVAKRFLKICGGKTMETKIRAAVYIRRQSFNIYAKTLPFCAEIGINDLLLAEMKIDEDDTR